MDINQKGSEEETNLVDQDCEIKYFRVNNCYNQNNYLEHSSQDMNCQQTL